MKQKFIIGMLIALFMVFAMISVVDSVSAVKWKKYDSGKFKDSYPPAGYKTTAQYESYVKGDNELYVNFYNLKKTDNKKHLASKWTLTKNNKKNIVKVVEETDFNEKTVTYFESNHSLKKIYKIARKEQFKLLSVPPKKAAFDKKTFNVKGLKLKTYAIQNGNYITIIGYIKNEEFLTVGISKIKDKFTIKSFDDKRKKTGKDTTFKSSSSLRSVYNIFIKELARGFSS